MLVSTKTNIYFAIKFSLREISFVVYVHAPIWELCLFQVGRFASLLKL